MRKQEEKANVDNKLLLKLCLIDLQTLVNQCVQLYGNVDSSDQNKLQQVFGLTLQAQTLLKGLLTSELQINPDGVVYTST